MLLYFVEFASSAYFDADKRRDDNDRLQQKTKLLLIWSVMRCGKRDDVV